MRWGYDGFIVDNRKPNVGLVIGFPWCFSGGHYLRNSL
jgi:hypothetical protein